MMITVTDLFDGVTPETSPITITVVEGSATSGGGGGAVDSVNGEVGVVVLDATDVGADATGAAAAAVAAHEADTTSVHGIADTSVLATDAEVATAVSDHAAATNPHPTYLTATEGDAAYDALGAATAAQAASQPLDGDLTTVAALDSTTAGALVTDGAGWIRKTYAQLKTALSLVKADVGLGSVDNTADTAKPVSTAQQTALDLKANLSGPTFTGDPKAPTASPGDNDTSIATTAFVTAAVAAGGGSGTAKKAIWATRTGGNVSVSSTTWVAFDTSLDLVVAAVAGDVLLLGLNGRTTTGPFYFDMQTWVSGAGVKSVGMNGAISATGVGVAGWQNANAGDQGVGSVAAYTVQSGDISAGTVTLRLVTRVTAGTKTAVADATNPFHVWAQNTGQ